MKKQDLSYELVETEGQLNRFYVDNKHMGWMAFDTEFIPEKYYKYKLCVISVTTSRGNYIFDLLKLKKITPFLEFIESPSVLKITHAGENDYQLLVEEYNVTPVNVFDTQLAYGFLQYDYPVGLQTLLSRQSNVKLDKSALRSDWERRPLSAEQCRYAVQDVVYLHSLMLSLKRRLKRSGKLAWVEEESRSLEDPDAYRNDPLDFLSAAQLNQMSHREQIFLMRMHMWRQLEAEKENRPVTTILKTRILNTIVQKMPRGEGALLKDRTLPSRLIRQNLDTFKQLYRRRVAPHEQELLDRIPSTTGISPRMAILVDMMHQVVKHKALSNKVSPKLIISSKELNLMKTSKNYMPPLLQKGWRKELLGPELLALLANRGEYEIEVKPKRFMVSVEPGKPSFWKRWFKKEEKSKKE